MTRKEVFPEPNQRFGRMSDYAKLGLAAIAFALRDAGTGDLEHKRPIGVVASTRLGCLATDLEYHQTVLLQGGGLASPNLFAYTLANCFLGDAAIQFGLTRLRHRHQRSTPEDGLGALRMALEELALGEARNDAGRDLRPPGSGGSGRFRVTLQPGALFLVLSVTPPVAPSGYGTVIAGR